MRFSGLAGLLNSVPEFKDLSEEFPAEGRGVWGLTDSQVGLFLSVIKDGYWKDKNVLLVTPNTEMGERLWADLQVFLPEDKVLFFPALEVLPHEQLSPDPQISRERFKVLEELTSETDSGKIVIAPLSALFRRLMPSADFSSAALSLERGREYQIEQITENLIYMNYQRVPMVEMPGEFSVRGGIVDIYPLTRENPLRIEFFGEEIDSIRTFDLATQRSIKEMGGAFVPPRVDILLEGRRIEEARQKIGKDLAEIKVSFQERGKLEEYQNLQQKTRGDLERIMEKIYFEGIEQYLPYFFQEGVSLFDYFQQGLVALLYPEKLAYRGEHGFQEIYEAYLSLLEQGDVLPGYQENFISWHEIERVMLNYPRLYLAAKREDLPSGLLQQVGLPGREAEIFRGDLGRLVKQVRKWYKQQKRIQITLGNRSKAKQLVSHLKENELPAIYKEDIDAPPNRGSIILSTGSPSAGMEIEGLDLVWLTEKEVLGKQKRYHKRTREFDEGVEITSFEELEVGDYVVHEQHGIGKYLGVKTLEVQGRHQDYLVVKYAGEDRLYVPTDKVHLIQKYIGVEGQPPRLYSLGGSEWNRVKSRVQESVKEMASELLELYAQREATRGHAFAEDTVWQKEFEEDFPYKETPDQLEAIKQVKKDMESPQPMDRLVCGDVGFGKTEVAIRAAFKAVIDGKQVAMLVPTTILAQQHFNTFQDRFGRFPVAVEMLSRFRTRAEQQAILQKLARGQVDIVIGTHRLLSKDVVFNDLGLLIIDEEQRFGVTHKEKLKDLKVNVDVLTLTATPIPRTLHMALVGIRDLSVIDTPPEDRYPIRTYVREYNEELIKEAIRREIQREGQVYFVHNRVEDIDKYAARIQELVPEARIAVGHGQMSERRLERIMLHFLQGKYDILVCTTIIESGLDISNVNTILINNADKMGLSQLYQLRGRVGRSNRVAYSYLLYKRGRMLAAIAEKRLRAIREFTNLGSGFKIAMRDLEIRGAGNILGPEQHGHIAAVGFSLYCKLLENEINQLKGKGKEEDRKASIDLEIDAFLPDEYIPDSRQKIEIYKKISSLSRQEDVVDLVDEIIDRFGDPPSPVENLIKIGQIKVKASALGIEEIVRRRDKVRIVFREDPPVSPQNILQLTNRFRRGVKVKAGRKLKLELKVSNLSGGQKVLDFLEKILGYLTANEV
ncbi:MAG: transcription-repair coupling factor [Halanaerobium sp.]|nr:transcription-repair coupling factor [Halanaerobium sp.]